MPEHIRWELATILLAEALVGAGARPVDAITRARNIIASLKKDGCQPPPCRPTFD